MVQRWKPLLNPRRDHRKRHSDTQAYVSHNGPPHNSTPFVLKKDYCEFILKTSKVIYIVKDLNVI